MAFPHLPNWVTAERNADHLPPAAPHLHNLNCAIAATAAAGAGKRRARIILFSLVAW